VIRTPRIDRRRGAARRALGELALSIGLAARALRARPDVVLASSPTMFLGPAAWCLARITRACFVWDIRDITWNYVDELARRRPHRLLAAPLMRAMWATARRADLVAAATPGILEMLREGGVADERLVLVSNAATAAPEPAPLPARNNGRRPSVAYVGFIGRLQGLDVLVDVAGALPDVDFVVAGEGPLRGDIESHAAERALANLRFTGYLAPDEVRAVYGDSDVLFAHLRRSPTLDRTALPTKLLEYMAAGRPIVYGGAGAAAEQIAAIGCGVAVAPEDAPAIAGAIRRVLADQAWAEELARRGRAHVAGSPDRHERAAALLDAIDARLRE
jgi:glycosyltransferase involved in cell wall biosynthesis